MGVLAVSRSRLAGPRAHSFLCFSNSAIFLAAMPVRCKSRYPFSPFNLLIVFKYVTNCNRCNPPLKRHCGGAIRDHRPMSTAVVSLTFKTRVKSGSRRCLDAEAWPPTAVLVLIFYASDLVVGCISNRSCGTTKWAK